MADMIEVRSLKFLGTTTWQNLSIYFSILPYCTTATKSAPLGFRGWLGWGQTTWRSWGRWHSKQTTTTRRMMKNRIRVMSRRRMKSLQTMDKLESPRKNNKTWLCEGLQPACVGWFYMLRMIVAVSYCAHAGFILKVLGFAWCKTCITLNLQFYSLGESRFLNGDFFFFSSYILVLLELLTFFGLLVQFKNKHFQRPVSLLNLCPEHHVQ